MGTSRNILSKDPIDGEQLEPQSPRISAIRSATHTVENRIPVFLIAVGLVLVFSAIYFLAGTQYALFTGLFIAGIVLLSLGISRLFGQPIRTKRFCMHCGFPMLNAEVKRRQMPQRADVWNGYESLSQLQCG